jgi:hypothetical protein
MSNVEVEGRDRNGCCRCGGTVCDCRMGKNDGAGTGAADGANVADGAGVAEEARDTAGVVIAVAGSLLPDCDPEASLRSPRLRFLLGCGRGADGPMIGETFTSSRDLGSVAPVLIAAASF